MLANRCDEHNFSLVRTPTGSYAAREDFQRRDVATLQPGIGALYCNGDIDAHVSLWKVLDDALVPLLNRHDFKRVRTTTDYGQWVRFKMDVIAHVYKKWCKASIIGRPIDVIVVTAKDGAQVV